MIDETKIIESILIGNTEDFTALVHRYQRPVISIVSNIVNNHHQCEDIAQDVFFDVYKKLKDFDSSKSKFSTWIFTIARNKSINAINKMKPITTDTIPEYATPNLPEKILEQQEFYKLLDDSLNKLSIEHKTAFVLAEIENLPYEEIALIEGVKLGTIKSRINRAKKKLKQIIDFCEATYE